MYPKLVAYCYIFVTRFSDFSSQVCEGWSRHSVLLIHRNGDFRIDNASDGFCDLFNIGYQCYLRTKNVKFGRQPKPICPNE